VVSTDQNGNAAAPPLTANNLPGQFTVTATVNSLTATFTLSNLGYTLGTASALVGGTAGNGTVLLSGYGAWTAASTDSWLHVATASGSGSRSALIQFSYDANGSPAVQTGTITIAGLAFTVTQAGAGYVTVYPVTGVAWPGLNLPHGIAVDAQGNIYAADSANNAVKQWNATNGQVTALVSSGLSDPTGVAVDTQGNVYIADSGNNAIREWVAATQQVTTLVSSGLSNPTGVAVDAVGNVYIADSGNQAVKEWNAATAQVSVLAASGLQSPAAVAVDAQGNIYIADSANNMVFEWNATAGLTPLISGLSGPAGVTVDGQADVYIADTGNNKVKQWSAATQQVTVLIEIEARIAFQRVQVRTMRKDPRGAHQLAGPIAASFSLARVQQEQVLARFRRRVIAISGMEVCDLTGRIFVWHVADRPANAGHIGSPSTDEFQAGRAKKRHREEACQIHPLRVEPHEDGEGFN
jgi:sugar lactone lactonase YvrE